MASPIRLSWMRHTFTAEGCDDLPAHVQMVDNARQITSAWKLTEEELGSVAATGLVTVQCLGVWPPMNVGAVIIDPPPEMTWNVTVAPNAPVQVDKFTDVLTFVLQACMNGAATIEIERL